MHIKLGCINLCYDYLHGFSNIANIIDEKGLKFDPEMVFLKGKQKSCLHLKEPVSKKKKLTYENVFEFGLNTKYICNKKMPDKSKCKENCPYYMQKQRSLETRRVTTVHHQMDRFILEFINRVPSYYRLILLIDEKFLDGIKKHLKMTRAGIQQHIQALIIAKKYIKSVTYKNRHKKMFKLDLEANIELLNGTMTYLLDFFYELLKAFKTKDIDYDDLKYRIDSFQSIFGEVKDKKCSITDAIEYTSMRDVSNIISELILKPPVSKNKKSLFRIKPFKFFFDIINWLLINSLFNDNSKIWLGGAVQYDEKSTYISVLFYNEVILKILKDNSNIFKLMINDASKYSQSILNLFHDPTIHNFSYDYFHNNWNFFQLINNIKNKNELDTALYPKASLLRIKTRNLLLEDIKAFDSCSWIPKKGHIVVTRNIKKEEFNTSEPEQTKSLNKMIQDLSSNILPLNYPLAATNEFKNYNQCTILGTPGVPIQTDEREAILQKLTYEELFYARRKDLIKQAYGRLRDNDIKYILILTAINLNLDKIGHIQNFYSHKELQRYFTSTIRGKSTNDIENDYIKELCKKQGYITAEDYLKQYKYTVVTARKKLNNKTFLNRQEIQASHQKGKKYKWTLK